MDSSAEATYQSSNSDRVNQGGTSHRRASSTEVIRAVILIGLTNEELLLVGPPEHDLGGTENVYRHRIGLAD